MDVDAMEAPPYTYPADWPAWAVLLSRAGTRLATVAVQLEASGQGAQAAAIATALRELGEAMADMRDRFGALDAAACARLAALGPR